MGLIESLRKAVEGSGMSDQRLADLVGVARPSITRFRLGQRSLKLSTAARLCEVLGLELREK